MITQLIRLNFTKYDVNHIQKVKDGMLNFEPEGQMEAKLYLS